MERSHAKLPPQIRIALEEVTLQFRRRLQVRGWLRFGAATLLLLVIGTLLLAMLGNDTARNTVIGGVVILEAGAAWLWVLRPRRAPISAEQVALYIDEEHPELENRIISAVALEKAGGTESRSLWMIEKFLEETGLAVRSIPFGEMTRVPSSMLGRVLAAGMLGAAAALLVMFGAYWWPSLHLPGFLIRPGVERLPFNVKPGDAEVRRGDNLVVLVESALTAGPVAIAWRTPTGEWQTAGMGASTGAKVHHHEFRNIQENYQYRVQAGAHISPVFTITAWEPPRVDDIHLSYRFPEYLNLPPEETPNGGPINAVEGTRVGIEVAVNKPIESAALVLESGERLPLKAQSDAVWSGELLVSRNDKYHIEVKDLQGRPSDYEPVYDITAVRDKPPEVRIAFPRGDDEVTPIEEIPFAVDVTDDYGVASVGIQYEVAGREPVRVALAGPEAEAALLETHGEHLLMLEDLGLSAGDLVTWTVWTEDRKPDRDPFETLGDPYFLEVRPFNRSFEEAISNAGANQGQQGGGGEQGLTEQRDVLIATWNLRRRAGEMTDDEFEEKRAAIVSAQAALLEKAREQGHGGMTAMPGPQPASPGVNAPELTQRLIEAQEKAVEALQRAERSNAAPALSEAMTHEQEAYSLLKKLEPERNSIQQAQGGGQGQGQSGGQREINELELARNRNFYEEEQVTRPPNQEAAEQTRKALQDLTQRQQIANDELARLISELQQAKTEKGREEIERRLKRLEEEMQRNLERLDQLSGQVASGEMDPQQAREAQQGLNQARREMNKSLEEVRQERLQQARAAGARAADALDNTQREMAGLSSEATAAGLKATRERMANLEERQQSILDRLEQLKQRAENQSLDDLSGQKSEQESLLEEKRALAEELKGLMEEAGRLAEGAQQNQSLMARKLNDWLRETSGTGILETMEETQPLVEHGIWDAALGEEQKVLEELQAAGEGLREVEGLLVEDEVDSLRLALQQIRGVLNEPGESGEPASEASADEPNEAQEGEVATPQAQAQEGQQGESPQGEGAQPGGGSPSEDEPNSSPEARGGMERAGADGGYGGYGGYGPDDLDRFVATDYGRWMDALRNAEDLLPDEPSEAGRDDVTTRQRLARAREAINDMRRDYKGSGVRPQYEGFLDRVVNPMEEAATEIDRRIRELLHENEFALDQRVDVPAQYKDRVAEYFRALSEAEAGRP